MSTEGPQVPDDAAEYPPPVVRPGRVPSVDELMMNPVPTASNLATTFGVNPDYPSEGPDLDESQRRQFMLYGLIPRMRLEPLEKVEALYSRFCARYLPALIDAFITPPRNADFEHCSQTVFTSYVDMLLQLQKDRYFAQLMLSSDPLPTRLSRGIVTCLAQRLVGDLGATERGIRTGLYSDAEFLARLWLALADVAELLCLLLTFQLARGDAPPLPRAVKAPLLSRLEWARRAAKDATTTDFFGLAAHLLEGSGEAADGAKRMARGREGLESCARAGCGARYDLLQCARCRTVLYCTRKHQAEHWRDATRPHKALCHKTEWKVT